MSALYDRIGGSYRHTRSEDPRIAAALHAALGDARSVVNVGAGCGSYFVTRNNGLLVLNGLLSPSSTGRRSTRVSCNHVSV